MGHMNFGSFPKIHGEPFLCILQVVPGGGGGGGGGFVGKIVCVRTP